jgi:hypothetical protein
VLVRCYDADTKYEEASMSVCPFCGAKVENEWTTCRSCGDVLPGREGQIEELEEPASSVVQTTPLPADIGAGSLPMPVEARGWNWGAFFLTWFWGVGNQVYLALLVLLPGVAAVLLEDSLLVVIPIVAELAFMVFLGVKGSEWAWRHRAWQSVEHFRRTQRKWAWAGLVWFVLATSAGVLLQLSVGGYLHGGSEISNASTSTTQSQGPTTYTDSEHGFSFSYSPALLPDSGDITSERSSGQDGPTSSFAFFDKTGTYGLIIDVYEMDGQFGESDLPALETQVEVTMVELHGSDPGAKLGEVSEVTADGLLGFQAEASFDIDGVTYRERRYFLYWAGVECHVVFEAPEDQWPDLEPTFSEIMATFSVTR